MSDTIERAFWEFHATNPHVYQRLVTMAKSARGRGHQRLGMKMLFEVIRWEQLLRTTDPGGFKLNNNFTAFYARLIMQHEPELAGLFETRGTRRQLGSAVAP